MTGLSPDFPLHPATYINCYVSIGPSPNITKGFKSLALQQQKNCKVYQWLPTLLSYLQTKRTDYLLVLQVIFLYGRPDKGGSVLCKITLTCQATLMYYTLLFQSLIPLFSIRPEMLVTDT